MENLASCYFCGAALDARLQRYPVVPEALRDDGDVTTATLCPACHQKLQTVVDAVVAAAAESGDATDDGTSETDMWESAAADLQRGGDDTDGADPDSDGPVTAADAASEDDGALRPAVQADGPDALGTGDDSDPAPAVSASADAGVADDDITAEDVDALTGEIDSDILDDEDDEDDEEAAALRSAMEADVPAAFQSGSDAATDGDDADTAEVVTDDAQTEADTDETPPTATDAPAEPTGDGTPGPASGAARTTVSALEYNKVMRLLQNRSFPVDRDEIETVAANAYDLSRAECGAVIDLAVDRGLVDEDGDRLVRPD